MPKAAELSLDLALALLPEHWQHSLCHLGSLASISNYNDLLETTCGQRWVLRRQAAAVGRLGLDRAQEQRLSQWAGEQGIGPVLLYGHIDHGILLSEYITPQQIDPSSALYIKKLAERLQQVHHWGAQRPLPFGCRQWDLLEHLDHYWAQLSPMFQAQLLPPQTSWPALRAYTAD
ncbi:MAG: hypothetical protein OIF38_08435, partial [Cellvibrionaceae bacterium]|nr:hypothetical protein [Cellvibrionaceae bacterium]